MQTIARHAPLLAAAVCICLVGMTGCSEALQTWWDAQHGGDHDHPSADAGKPNEQQDASTAVSCGSRGQPTCANDEFCSFPAASSCGDADQPGVCSVFPELCPTLVNPVCGCDGKTYNNECEAARIGVSVRADGACQPSTSATCGGLQGAQCPDGQYCDFAPDALCGSADATGACTDKPQICNDLFAPVCGCDDKTYSNACSAAAAGVSVVADGACAKVCGGIAGVPCPDGQYCDLAAGNGCDIADAQGRCAELPQLCTDIYAPVCGCNQETYSSACQAAVQGQSVRSPGACANKSL